MYFWLLAVFAGLALLLAVIGLYGVLSYAVNQRRREIGVRMAVGAQRWNVISLVVRQGMRLATIGLALGLIAAFASTRLLQNLLFGVNPVDPLTFAAIALLLIAVTAAACWFPAHRASKVNPMEALRYE